MTELELGKLIGIYGVSAVFAQRAFVLAAVSFVFFTAMVFGFLVRPGFVFVLLATAFLIVGLFTVLGWLAQRKAVFRLFEKGFSYKKFECLWTEIESISVKAESGLIGGAKINCLVRKIGGQELVLTETIADLENIVKILDAKTQIKPDNR